MANSTIYLDYASTTPIDPMVAKKMINFMTPEGEFGNPASRSHRYGWAADEAVEEARSHVAELRRRGSSTGQKAQSP